MFMGPYRRPCTARWVRLLNAILTTRRYLFARDFKGYGDPVERRAEKRFDIDTKVSCRIPATPILSIIRNMSPDGCMLEVTGTSLEPGGTVLLQLVEDQHVVGSVIWANRKRHGIQFERRVDVSTIENVRTNTTGVAESSLRGSDRPLRAIAHSVADYLLSANLRLGASLCGSVQGVVSLGQ